MIVNFAEPSALNWEFRTDILVFGGLVVIITLAFHYSYRTSAHAMSFKIRSLLGAAGLVGVAWYAYAVSYQHFIRADVADLGVRLTFVGPFSRDVVLARGDIAAVTYGLSDRGGFQCRVTVEGRHATYHSAWVADKTGICRGYRDDVLRALSNVAR